MRTPPCGLGVLASAVLAVVVATPLIVALIVRPPLRAGVEMFPGDRAVAPAGAGLLVLLLGLGVLLLLFGIFVLLLVLVVCNCRGKSGGVPLPVPDLPKVPEILRSIATALRTGADAVETANRAVDDVRNKFSAMTAFEVAVPDYRSIGHFMIGGRSVEVWVPDGTRQKPMFDDHTQQSVEAFIDDATGKAALAGAAGLMRENAQKLEEQAAALEG
jgi:hypothetical protein